MVFLCICSADARLFTVRHGMRRQASWAAVLATCLLLLSNFALVESADVTCPGSTTLSGHGPVSVVGAKWNKGKQAAGTVDFSGSSIQAGMKGRAYFGNQCGSNYDNTNYLALKLLGQKLSYTIDLSGAGCGCNAAFYLTAMHQNTDPTSCHDYYCDAAEVCGKRCAEIDIQEANARAWYSTLHASSDAAGIGSGYGADRRDWNSSVYGFGARCIDTTQPFRVSAAFPKDASGQLAAMEVTLSQAGKSCPLTLRVQGYFGMSELTEVLRQGVTPIISYWGVGETMLWMDGRGADGHGPCQAESAESCAQSVSFSGFSVDPIHQEPPEEAPSPQKSPRPMSPSRVIPAEPGVTPSPVTPLPLTPPPPMQGVNLNPSPKKSSSSLGSFSMPWLLLAAVGVLVLATACYCKLEAVQVRKEILLQKGTYVSLKNALVKDRSCLGRAKLNSGSKGRILRVAETSEVVVKFDGHWGDFVLSKEETAALEIA